MQQNQPDKSNTFTLRTSGYENLGHFTTSSLSKVKYKPKGKVVNIELVEREISTRAREQLQQLGL